jgi:hypothetical protein
MEALARSREAVSLHLRSPCGYRPACIRLELLGDWQRRLLDGTKPSQRLCFWRLVAVWVRDKGPVAPYGLKHHSRFVSVRRRRATVGRYGLLYPI